MSEANPKLVEMAAQRNDLIRVLNKILIEIPYKSAATIEAIKLLDSIEGKPKSDLTL